MNDTSGAYDDTRWQWIDNDFGPMGWFTDDAKRRHEGSEDFSAGHWRPVGKDERDSASADYTRLVREQA